ncbi:MAG: hypothetical protein KDJ73_12695 [Notoacmeibacter sp.]|nr:hypothetical protein [Notoacmeibacter sp.]MCC0031840.1 hypothetical protein [Brucellaceae bacterium]
MLCAVLPVSQVGAKDLPVCHGYGCTFSKPLPLTAADEEKLAAIMAPGAASPEAERTALASAIAYLETRSVAVLGVRDFAKAALTGAGRAGQMDCIDESTNSTTFLRHLEAKNLLRHHSVEKPTSRGIMIDGRYPHWTAVLKAADGGKWAVDSWYEPGGGKPDVMPLGEWRKRGVGGQR